MKDNIPYNLIINPLNMKGKNYVKKIKKQVRVNTS